MPVPKLTPTQQETLHQNQIFTFRVRQLIIAAAIDIASEQASPRTELASAILRAPDTWKHVFSSALISQLDTTSPTDKQIFAAISALWNTVAGK